MQYTPLLFVPLVFGLSAAQVCPGFNFAIGNMQHDDGVRINYWNIYDTSCNVYDVIATNDNVCADSNGVLSCTADPVMFNQYYDQTANLHYVCRPDPNSGLCGSDTISVCCRNDGN